MFIVVLYNSAADSSKQANLNPLSADSIASVMDQAMGPISTESVSLLLLGVVSASALTMFNVGATFAVFQHQPKAILSGFRAVMSRRTFEYALVQICVLTSFAGGFFLVVRAVADSAAVDDRLGGVLLIAVFSVGYPILYMILSTTALLIGADGPLHLKLVTGHVFLKWPNLKKLTLFYLVRIGSEVAALALLASIAANLGLSPIIGLLLGVAAATLPLALVRTAGFLIKLDILEGAAWFRSNFLDYYEDGGRSSGAAQKA
ncbi:MAG TPA: hypothetical protein VF662_13215 [Allosphingosinicella sp.]